VVGEVFHLPHLIHHDGSHPIDRLPFLIHRPLHSAIREINDLSRVATMLTDVAQMAPDELFLRRKVLPGASREIRIAAGGGFIFGGRGPSRDEKKRNQTQGFQLERPPYMEG